MKKAKNIILAAVFILLGIVGLIIPVVPQVPFFAAGLFFLCMYSPKFKTTLKRSRIYQRYVKKHVESNARFKDMMDEEE